MNTRRCIAASVIAIGSLVVVPSVAFAQTGYGTDPVPSSVAPASSTTNVSVLGNSAANNPSSNSSSSKLPLTGADIAGIAAIAVGACGIGTVLVVTGRRRARAAA
jgi:LPXTG-motif cell wall-anchored protein